MMTTAHGRIVTEAEFEATLERIRHFQAQLLHLRAVETDPQAFQLSAAGFLAELDTMQAAVRMYLGSPSGDVAACRPLRST